MNSEDRACKRVESSVLVKTSPSLALIKYWGKEKHGYNIPATTSIAVTLEGLTTTTLLQRPGTGKLTIQTGSEVLEQSLKDYIETIKRYNKITILPDAYSVNNFPTAAGIASSSSGFAALALGMLCMEETLLHPSCNISACFEDKSFLKRASMLARLGSVSASRAVYEGFTILQRGSCFAEQLAPPDYWNDLRIMVAVVSHGKKAVASRNGMKLTADTSPYYKAWLVDAKKLSGEALRAFYTKDLEKLGTCMRASYLRMHACAMAGGEPVLYWIPESLAVISIADQLRKEGFSVWETMDAGPQVKFLYLVQEETALLTRFRTLLETYNKSLSETIKILQAKPGGKPQVQIPDGAQRDMFLGKFSG